MKKDLKKAYKYLQLSDSATKEDVEARKNALIKIANSKRFEGKTFENEVDRIESAAKIVSLNIKEEKTIEKKFKYECSNDSIAALMITLIFIVSICLYSFYVLL